MWGGGSDKKLILTEGQQGEQHSACYLGFEFGFWGGGAWCVHFQRFFFLLLMNTFDIDCSSHIYSSASVNRIKI